jgi:hypothetical protein
MPNLTMENLFAQINNVAMERQDDDHKRKVRSVLSTLNPFFGGSVPTTSALLSALIRVTQVFARLHSEIRQQESKLWIKMDFEATQEYWRASPGCG